VTASVVTGVGWIVVLVVLVAAGIARVSRRRPPVACAHRGAARPETAAAWAKRNVDAIFNARPRGSGPSGRTGMGRVGVGT